MLVAEVDKLSAVGGLRKIYSIDRGATRSITIDASQRALK